MLPTIALSIGLFGIAALLIQDVRWRPKVSAGGWIPLVWVLIIGSRPLSLWLSPSMPVEAFAQDSPIDRMYYMAIIASGIAVLIVRQVRWSPFIARNKWVFLYFAYFAMSALWSDYMFDSVKRWIKDFGNIVMVLIVLSERNPIEAIKALLVRATYVLIPLSVIFVKYFPELSRRYDRWSGFSWDSGVTTDKNLLGMVLAALAISLLWVLLSLRDEVPRRGKKLHALVHFTMLAMILWLLMIANSATAVVCSTLGAAILILVRFDTIRKHGRAYLGFGAVVAVLLVMTGIWSHLHDTLLDYLGRDPSLTGRKEIWEAVLRENTNPVFGVGFYSFWMGDRVARLSAAYHYPLNEAHNGYLETYLNGGFIGLALLCMVLWSAANRALSSLATGPRGGIDSLRLTFVVVAAVYGFSEAINSRLDVVWFGLLLAICVYPQSDKVVVGPRFHGKLAKDG